MAFQLGTLIGVPASQRTDLLDQVGVAEIDPAISETASTQEVYGLEVPGAPLVVIGSGVRRSKILIAGALLAQLPAAQVADGLGV